jgi:hypothetical protein
MKKFEPTADGRIQVSRSMGEIEDDFGWRIIGVEIALIQSQAHGKKGARNQHAKSCTCRKIAQAKRERMGDAQNGDFVSTRNHAPNAKRRNVDTQNSRFRAGKVVQIARKLCDV